MGAHHVKKSSNRIKVIWGFLALLTFLNALAWIVGIIIHA